MCSKGKAKWFKSLLACLLVIAMCVTGCGKKEEPAPSNEVKQSVESTELGDEEAPLGNLDIESEPEETENEDASDAEEEIEEEQEEVEEGIVLEEGTTLLFEGGTPDSGFTTEDVEWFMTAPDDAVFTVVYSCNDASHVDWGVAGFIAVVEGVEMKGPELYAHKEDATKKVYVTCTVKDLKECLQITEGKIVGSFMVGAWNGGQISEIYITTDGKLPEVKGAEKAEFIKKVAVDTSDLQPSDMTGNYMFVYTDLVTIDFRTDKYCPGYVVGDTIAVEVKMESDASFLGCFGTCVGSDYAWHMEEYKSEVGEPITVKFEITPSIDTLQFQIWWMGGTKVGVSSISITTVGKTTAAAPAPAPSYPSGGGTNVNPGQGNTGTTDNGVVRDYTDVLTASNAAEDTHMATETTVGGYQTALTIRSPKEGVILDSATLNDDNYFVVEYVGASAPVFQIPKGETTVVVNPCDTSVAGYAIYALADMQEAFGTALADVNLVLANASDATITVNSMKLVSAVETTSVATVQELDAVDYSELINKPGRTLITEPVTCEPEAVAFTLFDPDGNSFLDLTQVNDKNFHVVVEYTTPYPPGLAINGPKNDWAKVAPCYVVVPVSDGNGGIIPGKAVFSYAEMVASYGSLEDVSAIAIWNKTDKSDLTVTEVKTFDVEVAADTNAVDDAIYRGSAEGRGWNDDNYMNLGASHFADVTFDGSKKLVITYVSTYMHEDTMFQLATDNYSTVLESGINGGRQANFAVKEFVLTNKFASIAQAGLIIHGCNWTITKIMIDDVVAGPNDDNENENTDPLSGSIVLNDTAWWTQKNISKNDLLCGQSLENIAKITFSSTGNFVIGFNNLDGSGTITEYNKDPHWSQIEGASEYVLDLDNINFDVYNFIVALTNHEGVDYTITWKVELKDGVTPEQPGTNEPAGPQIELGKGSVSFVADSGWTEYELSKDELLCGVELDKVAGFKFSGETNISVGFTGVTGWTQYQDKTSHEVGIEEFSFEAFAFKFALSNNNNQEYTIRWEVVLKEEGGDQGGEGGQQPQPEVGKGSMVFTEKTGWVQQAISKEQLLAGVAEEQVAGFKFNCTIDMYVGFNGAAGGWVEHKDKPNHEISVEEIDMAGFGMNLALWNETTEYTITWEVVLKEEGGDQGGDGQNPEGGDQGGNEGGQDPVDPEPEPTPDPEPQPNPTGSLVFETVAEAAWIEKAVTKEQIFCGVDPAEVASIKFSGSCYIYVGFNGAAGGWTEYKDQVSHVIPVEEMAIDGFGMNLALWNDCNEYTVTWEVIMK